MQTRDGPLVIPLAGQGHTKKSKPNIDSENNKNINNITNTNNSNAPKSLDQLAAEAIIKGNIFFILYY